MFLENEGVKPVLQMKIAMRVRSAERAPATFEIYNTIHDLAGQ